MLTRFMLSIFGIGLILMMITPILLAGEPGVKKYRVYLGTYTGGKSKGIYRSELDLATGRLSEPSLATESINPSFVEIHPNGKYLYAVSEVDQFQGKSMGVVSAFAIDPAGNLTLLNQQGSEGTGPCHLSIDREGKNVLVANYSGGSICALPIDTDGKLKPASSAIQHKGSSVNKQRQEAPHAHSINPAPDNRFAFAADLGLDKVFIYRLDAAQGKLSANDPPFVALAPGAGPRHFAFHPDGKAAYVINELDCTITPLIYDAQNGSLTPGKSVTTLPDKMKPSYSTAEIRVHPSGKFVYGSNRGQNTIAIFRVDPATHELTPAGHQGAGVKTPRNFNLDPTGQYLLVANQDGDSVLVFRVDPATGALTPTGSEIVVGRPVCIRMMPIR